MPKAKKKKSSGGSGKMPEKVIEKHARALGRNKRALGIYKRVLKLS
jgi:hypothetical protein